jgi:PAS domain S-box-containing protein
MSRRSLLGLALAAASVAAAILLRWISEPVLGERTPFILLWPAVMLTAWYGGRIPGLVAVALGALGTTAMFPVEPEMSTATYWAGLGLFVVVAVSMIEIVMAMRRAEHRRQRTAERLDLTLAAGKLGVWEWNLVTNEVWWSDSLEEVHGLPRGAFGRTFEAFRQLVHHDDRASVDAALDKAIASCGEYQIEYRFLRPDGTLRWMTTTGRVFGNEHGRPMRLVGTAMDTTPHKQAEEALRDADRRKDEFIAILAHELRNPLAPIRLALEMLRDSKDKLVSNRAIEIMSRQLAHLVRLIDDLLDVSRITRGKLELRRADVDLHDVVRSALEGARPAIDAAGHRLVVSLPDEPIALHADLTRLAQVIANLLTNAARYTPKGGCIELIAQADRGELSITVRDNGIGLAPEHLGAVFEMFAQVAPAGTRSQGGLGIGLALARQLVLMHGGRIAAASGGLGKGSAFTIHLPIVDAPAKPLAASDPVMVAHVVRRVLIADDNRDAIDTLAQFLESTGHLVRTANNGAEAIEIAETFQPDVAVLDIGMPILDGHEVARQLRARKDSDGLVLIALTGWGQAEDLRRSREAGFDYHLTKPVQPSTLVKLLSAPRPG